MSVHRALLVGLGLLAVLTIPGPADAATPRATASASTYDTTIRYLNFHHVRAFRDSVTISGQVVATVNGTTGAVGGVSVSLYRKVGGSGAWQRVDATQTTQTDTPEFHFTVVTPATAQYQVRFAGDTTYNQSTGTTRVGVHRIITGRIKDHIGRLSGRVTPGYAHRFVHLEKRACLHCGWKTVRTVRAADHGRYRFFVAAPQAKRWYWRVTTSATNKFVQSSSAVFSSRLV